MKKLLRKFTRSSSIARLGGFVFVFLIAAGPSGNAEELKKAHISQVIQDVKLLGSNAAPRPAAVNDSVDEGTAVRTGVSSRVELTFTDLTITRLGENTIFSYRAGTRELDLSGGAVLVEVPPKGAAIKINTAAVTAAITGGTALFSKGPPSKFLVLEGTGTFYRTGHPEEAETVHGGEMVMMTKDGKITKPTKFNAALVYKTAKLITSFPTLPNEDLILAVIEEQEAALSEGPPDPPPKYPGDEADLAIVSTPTSPATTSLKFGPLSVITTPNPYVITSGTLIGTDPTITSGGKTDLGKLYRGTALDGSPPEYLFGQAPTAFDQIVFSGPQNNLPVAIFKFANLQLTGDPTISIPSGATTFLGLVSVGNITSGVPGPAGGTLTFAGISRLGFITQNGSINLGSQILFSGIDHLTFYARGSGSNLTLASAISGGSVVHLNAEGTVQVNGNITVTDEFRSISGSDFLTGTGTITALNLDIESLSNITFDSSLFPDVAGGSLNLNAAGTLDITVTGGTYGRDSLTAQGQTINLTSPGVVTLDFLNATVLFTAGTGGINAPNIDFTGSGAGLNFISAGSITAHSIITSGFADGTIAANGGTLTLTTDLLSGAVSALTDISVGGNATTQSLDAGGTITVGGEMRAFGSITAGGDITADTVAISSGGITTPGNLIAGSGGIHPFVISPGGAALQATATVATITSPNGIDFSGNQFLGIDGLSSGGRLTVNANTITFDPASGVAFANFNGADSAAFGSGSPPDGGDGGVFIVNTTGDITANNGADIMATTGLNSAAGVFSGAGGSVTLHSSGGMVTVNDTIQVSSDDAAASRQSDSGGTILLQSNLTTGPGITVGANAKLLSLLNNSAVGPGGSITLSTMGANITVSPGAVIQADRGTISMDQMDPPNQIPIISIEGATLSSQALRINGAGDLDIGLLFPVTIHADSVSLSVAHDLHLGVITLSGLAGGLSGSANIAGGAISRATNGGVLNINANSLTIGAGLFASVTLNGADASSTLGPGDGGTLNVNTTGDITANSGADITATTGLNSATGVFNGAGGSVALQSSSGTVAVNDTIQVSSDDAPAQRQSASGGDINITSGKTTGVAINVSNSAQLLSLLNAAAPGPGGKITILATAPTSNSSVNISGTVRADRGTVDIEHAGDNGQINISNVDMRADIVKIGAFGTNGTLNIGGGILSADTTLKLYAPGSNGTINFIADVTLSGASAKIIAGDTVNIFDAVIVTIGGARPASVFTNHANYTGFGGNGSRTGTFAGAGATNPQPLSGAPPFGP